MTYFVGGGLLIIGVVLVVVLVNMAMGRSKER